MTATEPRRAASGALYAMVDGRPRKIKGTVESINEDFARLNAELRRLRISQLRRMAEIAESHGAHMVREAAPHIDLHPYYLKDVQQGEKLLRFAVACRAEIERLRGER